MHAKEIMEILSASYACSSSVFVPEFTYGDLRVDAIIIDTKKRWIRAFEIKTSKADFVQDDKWTMYSQFCSSLSIICPADLIQPEEVKKPFGLLWVLPMVLQNPYSAQNRRLAWKKYPQNFQKRNSLAWLWTYVRVIEMELVRLNWEVHNKYAR